MRKIWIALLVIFALASFAGAITFNLKMNIAQHAVDRCTKKVDSLTKNWQNVEKSIKDSSLVAWDSVKTLNQKLTPKPKPVIRYVKKDTVKTEFNLTEIQGIQQKYQKDAASK